MSRTSALTRKPKGLGRPNFAQGYPRSHATPHRLKGQKVKSQGHEVNCTAAKCANISQTDKATLFKFGTHIGSGQFLPPDHKLALSGRGLGYVTQFRNFGTPSIFRKRIKLYDLQIWHAHRPWAVLAHGPQIGPLDPSQTQNCQQGTS